MRKLIFVATLLSCVFSYSQSKDFKITGKIVSEDDQTPLEAATVYLERKKDSSLVTYTISNKDGGFELEDKTSDENLNLLVSYVGYQTYKQQVAINKTQINIGDIKLKVSTDALDEVLIKSSAPVTIKKDTLEFNVSSFKTKKDANVEDLLKQLPGVEIDDEGKIKVNGKEVNKILVNGKPFFGNDPSITTKNLTKEIIEKIQVVDTKTKSEAFTGEEGDTENKTINLTIKEENNKGVFGRVAAGVGTDKRYEFAGMFNRFDNDQRVSVLLGGNNINSPGFSFGEIEKMFGGGENTWFNSNGSFSINGRQFGGGEGITTSKLAGTNYADNFGEKTEVAADYFYSKSNSENDKSSQRETILSDSRYFSNSRSTSSNDTQSHTINTDFEIKIDTTFMINVKPSFAFSKTTTDYVSEDETLDENLTLTNQSSLNSFVESKLNNFSNEISATKKFGNKGAYLKFEIDNSFNKNESDDYINSNSEVFGTSPETIIRNQFTDDSRKSNDFSTDVTYRLPIKAKEFFVNFEYEYQYNKDENTKSTYDFDETTNTYNSFNEALSTDFNYTDVKSSPGVQLSYRNEKFSARFGMDYIFRTLKNKDGLRPQFDVERDFKAIEMSSNFNYKFSKKASVYANYRLRNRPPSLRQLQAFEDVSNPLNTIVGNPNLEPTNENNLYVGFNAYNWQERTGFYMYANLTKSNNAVVSKTIVDPETLKRTTTYDNVNGNQNGYFGLDYSKSFKIDSLRTIRVKIGNWTNFSKNINYNNNVQYASKSVGFNPNVGVDFIWKDVFEVKPRYRISFTNNKYDIEAFNDRNYTSHNIDINTAFFLPKGFEWRNDITYNYNSNIADGFQKSAWFWNASLAYSVLKDKGTLSLKVYDLLNQNTNARRRATQDYIEDTQSTVLRQYFMLNFSWKFNSLGTKGETEGNGHYYVD
ncbi:Outer membrane receptor proteins, mostly Fe transport [Flaviramulus basaltis]|uniref:Outer membrane receptor proteins, mostly Fe transport n=1 Tax=Flaviramulus basaltis TaxID=369401 RepID=A0A1K2ILA4_9FLAO|nr:outer membrane beta-barrel protein [Flaviramulus basaltis]SFZ93245.1 Outer membrane receptor proteins, mostly Fe transport [Flaviramulus basaltis]